MSEKMPETEQKPEKPEHHGWWTHGRKIGMGIAVAAVVCGLVAIVNTAQPAAETDTEPEPTETMQWVAEKDTDLSENDVENIAESELTYAGTNVSADVGTAQVIVDSGHIMITQSSDDNASTRVDNAAKRAAATMAKVLEDNSTVKGSKPVDVTWVMSDNEGTPKVAVRVTPDSNSTHAATNDNADSSTVSAITGSDGWSMSDDTHEELDDPDSIPQTGGNTPTTPDGTEIVPPANATEDSEDQGSTEQTGDTENAGNDSPVDSGSASAPANTTSVDNGSGSSNTANETGSSQPTHTHTWEPIYQSKWVQDSAAWDEPIYSTTVKYRCSACGALFNTVDEWADHDEDVHNLNSSYSSKSVTTQTGTKHHDATGHYEQVVVGYRCSGCGATK